MWMVLQNEKADDWVLATGEQHSVKEFCELSFAKMGYEIEWQGKHLDEVGIDKKTGKVLIKVDAEYFRPTEVETLLGDSTKAHTELGWKPKYTFEQLVDEMVAEALYALETGEDKWA
eukprot:Tbor_TRINITY_DN3547_c0_g1::TRINITY_DN3547_c0_g1_i3::g.2889::m.2889/K01711/gmd, GMDS; GDPmannose 4,6-dehydratase